MQLVCGYPGFLKPQQETLRQLGAWCAYLGEVLGNLTHCLGAVAWADAPISDEEILRKTIPVLARSFPP